MDIIAKCAEALQSISDEGIEVAQGWYDGKRQDCHVTLWPLDSGDGEYSDDEADTARAVVQVTIFSTQDETALRNRIIKLMKVAGASYLGSDQDGAESQDGIYMKPSRFEFYEEEQENA